MGLLSQNRATSSQKSADEIVRAAEANTTIFQGSIVAIDSNGFAVPAQPLGAAPLDSLEVIGVCIGVLNGTPGDVAANTVLATTMYPLESGFNLGDAGAIKIRVRRGIFGMDNDGSITETNVARCPLVFAVDDHTVGISDASATLPCAGRALFIDAETQQVFIDTRDKAVTATVAGV